MQNLWYFDRFYTWFVLRLLHTCQVVCGHFDRVFVDGFVNFWGSVCRFFTGAAGVLDYWGVDGTVRGSPTLSASGAAACGVPRLVFCRSTFMLRSIFRAGFYSWSLCVMSL